MRTDHPIVPGDLFARHQTISGLHELADFLEANPAVPIHEYGEEFTFYTRGGSDDEQRAEVDRIAALLGSEVHDGTKCGGHYTTFRMFGRVSLRVVHIPSRRQEEHLARMSYAENIRLDQADDESQGRAA